MSGAIVSCVASVEVQLSVAASPFSTAVGLACSDTVGWAAAGGGGALGGAETCFGFLLQPNVKTEAASTAIRPARYSDRGTSIIQILLSNVIPVFVPRLLDILAPAEGFRRYLVSRYVIYRTHSPVTERLTGRPVGRFVVARGGQH